MEVDTSMLLTVCRSSRFQKTEEEMPLGAGARFSQFLLELIIVFPLILGSNNSLHYYLIILQIQLILSKP